MPNAAAPIARQNANDEAAHAARWLQERHVAGDAWRDLVVAAPGKRNWRDPLAAALDRAGIPYRMLLGDPDALPDPTVDQVHVMTLHRMQDHRCGALIIVGVGDLPWKQQTLDEAAALVDGAMGRAADAAAISFSKRSALVERLSHA